MSKDTPPLGRRESPPSRGGSQLRKAAKEAQEARVDAAAKTEQEKADRLARDALDRVSKSPLGRWFPEVVWEYVADIPSGATLVREKDGLDLVLGVKVTGGNDQGPEEYKVGVYEAGPGKKPEGWKRIHVLEVAADLGEYLDTPQPA